jgi:hypothetical protein
MPRRSSTAPEVSSAQRADAIARYLHGKLAAKGWPTRHASPANLMARANQVMAQLGKTRQYVGEGLDQSAIGELNRLANVLQSKCGTRVRDRARAAKSGFQLTDYGVQRRLDQATAERFANDLVLPL